MRPGRLAALGAALLCAACTVGPDYQRPSAPVAAAYKEQKGWKPAAPSDAIPRGAWWAIYNDPLLDSLERQVNVSNQTVKEYEAAYRSAVALTHEAQGGLFPTLSVTPDVTRSNGGGVRSLGSGSSGSGFRGSSGPFTEYSLEGSASWVPDVWGRIRRQVESQAAAAQVNAADLANAQLSAQATLATDYFGLRYEDSLQRLLEQTVAAYRRALQITENQYKAGTISRADVVTAEAQLQGVVAQLAGVGVQRAQYEHAIAMLIGKTPDQLSIPFSPLPNAVPVVPAGVPSTLLERRPDIAAAERAMQEQNALIGYNIAAFYPTISLTATGGFAGNPISGLLSVADSLWSIGASATQNLFEGGTRTAAVQAARATYEQAVATYRQTVLTAFQQVEDELAALRILQNQAAAEDNAVHAAQRALDVVLNEYRAGTVAYTSVITQQETLLSDQQSALAVQQSRFIASVALVQALGGGWAASELPSEDSITGTPLQTLRRVATP